MDLATLSFSIDSSQALQAKDNLDKMKGASVDATEQAMRLTRAFLDGKDPLAAYRAELALMDSNLRNTGAGIDVLVDRVRLMGAAMSGAAGPTKEFSQAMGQLQAAAAMFDTSTRSLEMFVRTTRDLGVSSQEMVSGLQRIQAALQGIGEEGRRAREVLRNYGVGLDGRGPNDAAAVYREFVDRARGYRMDANTYDDYRAVVGNVSIQSFAGLRDPDFRTTAQVQREIDATAQAARIAEIRESTFAIGRGTNRYRNELNDLESEYGTYWEGGPSIFTSPQARRAELERRRAAGIMSNTDYYRNRAAPGEGFASQYLSDLGSVPNERFFGTPIPNIASNLLGFAERMRLGGQWRSSAEYDENNQSIDAIYNARVAREGWWTRLPIIGSASRERQINRMLNGDRLYSPPPIDITQQENDRLPAYLTTTAAMGAMRYEGGDPLAQQRRRLVMDALQRLGINVPDAEMLPLGTLEARLGAARGGMRNMEALNARSLLLDRNSVDAMLEIEPYTFGVETPFAGRRRERDLARFGTRGLYGDISITEGASTGGWQGATSEAEANRADRVAQIIVATQRQYRDETERTRAVKERIAELDQVSADQLARQVAQQERLSSQTGRRLNALGSYDLSDADGLSVQMRILAAQEQSENTPGTASQSPGFFLERAAQNELNRLSAERLQRRVALGRTDEILGMQEGGMTQYEISQRMEINDQVRELERLEKALAETVGVQSEKRTRVLDEIRKTREELEKIQQIEAQQAAQSANATNRQRSVVLQDDIIRMQSMRLSGNLDQMAQEDAALALALPQYGKKLGGLSSAQAIAWLQSQGVWEGFQDVAFANQVRDNERIFPMLEGQIGLVQAGRSPIPTIARAQMQRAQLAMIPFQFPGNEALQEAYRRLYQESFSTQNSLAAQNPIEAAEMAANRAYDQRFLLDSGRTSTSARVDADLNAAMEQYRRNASLSPGDENRFLDAEIMRRVEEGLLGIVDAAAGAKESLEALEATRGMTPAQQRFYMATQANPVIQGLETLRDRYEPGSERFDEIERQIALARRRAGETEERRNRARFITEGRSINDQLSDAEFLADGWWMSGARRERELAQRRAERELRGTPGITEEEIQQRMDAVGRLAGYSEIARQNQLIRDSFLQVGNAAGTALDQIILKGGNARQVMAALLASLASSAIRLGTNRLFEFGLDALGAGARGLGLFGSTTVNAFTTTATSTAPPNIMAQLFPAGSGVAAAQGHAFGPGGLIPMAQGGSLIRSPTYFPMANGGVALGGEAGPEAILPLGRDSRGRLGVVGGGGATNNYNVTINMQGSSGNAAQDAKAAEMVGKMVRAELEKFATDHTRQQMQPGGMLAGGGAPVYG